MEKKMDDPSGDMTEDDGSVPEKQIQRWKDEGGAVLPPEEPEPEEQP